MTSQKGRTQLLHKGFYYVREKKIRNKVYWRCTQYTTWRRCHGRLHTDDGRIVHTSSHNNNCAEGGGEKPNMRKFKSMKMFILQEPPTNQILPTITQSFRDPPIILPPVLPGHPNTNNNNTLLSNSLTNYDTNILTNVISLTGS